MRPSLAQKKGCVTPHMCYAPSWQYNACVCHVAGGFVSLWSAGLEARGMMLAASTRAMLSDNLHTKVW